MRKMLLCLIGCLVLFSALLMGCSSGPHAKFGYSTSEKDGRLYVFSGMNSSEYQKFKRNGELGKSVTRIGAGPNGMTIIAPDATTIDGYLAAK